MRTRIPIRPLGAALLLTGALTLTATGTAEANNNGGPVWGTVVSRGDMNLRADPDTRSRVVGYLPSGSQDRLECATYGAYVNGNPYWYWLGGARAWASGAFMQPDRQVPMCGGRPGHHTNTNCDQECWDPCWHGGRRSAERYDGRYEGGRRTN
ncbi:SH3 domain-containing protein [Streptomyces sp. T-3]|nr:SH3 domain-containing protein [Streptomyces sp. T-3]